MRGRNRAHVKARLRDVLAWVYRAEDMTVSYSLDTIPETTNVCQLLGMTGENEPESIDGFLSTDIYTIAVRIDSHGHDTAEEAEIEVDRLIAILEDGIASSDRLMHPDVPFEVDANGAPYFDGVQTPRVSIIEGPQSGHPQSGGSMVGWADLQIECRTNVMRSN